MVWRTDDALVAAEQSYTQTKSCLREVRVMDFYWLGLAILAVWRITHLLSAEDGPWEVFVRLRQFVGNGFWGGLLDCFYCLSLWSAAPFAYGLGNSWKEQLLLWPALSAGSILLERLTSERLEREAPPATYFESQIPPAKPEVFGCDPLTGGSTPGAAQGG
jgi:hypothetical protein